MSCFICRRGNCTPMFHSHEEQEAFSEADEAYDKFVDVWEKCREDWLNQGEEDQDDE